MFIETESHDFLFNKIYAYNKIVEQNKNNLVLS